MSVPGGSCTRGACLVTFHPLAFILWFFYSTTSWLDPEDIVWNSFYKSLTHGRENYYPRADMQPAVTGLYNFSFLPSTLSRENTCLFWTPVTTVAPTALLSNQAEQCRISKQKHTSTKPFVVSTRNEWWCTLVHTFLYVCICFQLWAGAASGE